MWLEERRKFIELWITPLYGDAIFNKFSRLCWTESTEVDPSWFLPPKEEKRLSHFFLDEELRFNLIFIKFESRLKSRFMIIAAHDSFLSRRISDIAKFFISVFAASPLRLFHKWEMCPIISRIYIKISIFAAIRNWWGVTFHVMKTRIIAIFNID